MLFLFGCSEVQEQQASLVTYVDPFIGTDGKGKTYPGATVPFGRVQLSPDNGRNGWDWISGYFYPDTVIGGFSHLHLTGTGAGDLYDISFLPTSGNLQQAQLDSISPKSTVFSKFSHENEIASPGYYQVYLEDYKVTVELTATERTGLQRYSFECSDNKVRLNLGYSRNWDRVTDSFIAFTSDTTIIGYRHSDGWAKNQKVFFVSVFSEPVHNYELFENGIAQPQGKLFGKDILAICDFGDTKEVMVKTGISSISIDKAAANLKLEQPNFDFQKVKDAASFKWEVALQKVKIQASEDNMKQFYTAMYHSMLAPTLFSDTDGSYLGPDQRAHTTSNYNRYSTYSLWDTFRAQHPWLSIVQHKRIPDMMSSLLDFQSESGVLPVWNMQGSETNMMIGYHAIPVLADAILKGFVSDTVRALEAMKASAMQNEYGLKDYRELGYVPHDSLHWSVSMTMEYAYDDWCIAQVAKLLNREEDYHYYKKRSKNYNHLFDPKTGFFRAKGEDGSFKPGFDPLAYHPDDYCEANAFQYYWFVPHNIENLIQLAGGPSRFEAKLDSLFDTEQTAETPEWISGYIGQYVHGNEPGHHIPYLYQFIGKPEKTQYWTRKIMDSLYHTSPDGLAGNEDCGQLSAWYLFSALGFYPVNPADGQYILGSPEVHEASIQLPGKKFFKIKALNQSEENVYVSRVLLNGDVLTEYYISYDQIMEGGELVFEMSNVPVE